ncbi:MAG TPA: hypothetical protein VMV56_07690 [Williamwhitmania sp.]|nr:hypothetical protein [Williamwhitmania sp.]
MKQVIVFLLILFGCFCIFCGASNNNSETKKDVDPSENNNINMIEEFKWLLSGQSGGRIFAITDSTFIFYPHKDTIVYQIKDLFPENNDQWEVQNENATNEGIIFITDIICCEL